MSAPMTLPTRNATESSQTGRLVTRPFDLTIRRLLTLWVAIGVVATLILAGAAAYSTIRLTGLQQRVVEQVLPLEASGRRIGALLLEYLTHQDQLLQTQSLEALGKLPDRGPLDGRFNAELERLGRTIQTFPGMEPILAGLKQAHTAFLEQDDRLREQMRRDLEIRQKLKTQITALDQTVERMTTHAEGIKGKVSLATVRGKRQTRRALEGRGTEDLKSLAVQMISGGAGRIAQVTEKSLASVNTLSILSRQIRLEKTPDLLTSLKANQLKPAVDLARQSINALKGASDQAQSGIAELAAGLDKEFNTLVKLLVEGDEAVYTLAWNGLEVGSQIETSRKNAESIQQQVLGQLEKIGVAVDGFNEETTRESASVSRTGQILVYTVTLIVVLFMVGFGLKLARRISSSLDQAVVGVNRIAEGDLTTELKAVSRDELGQLILAMSGMAAILKGIFASLNEGSGNLSEAARELAQVSGALNASAQLLTDQSSTVAGGVDRSSLNLQHISTDAEQASANLATLSHAAEVASHNLNTISAAAEEASISLTQVVTSAQQATQRMAEVKDAAEQTSGNVTSVAGSVRAMTDALGEIRQRCLMASQSSEQANHEAERTQAVMERLLESAQEIHKVVDVINSIAEQTNMLALN
ncbi:MAG: methyl-accepting chemotaxis protein, partial [Magnetococcales bacterium]|nr:methyl-accepting chemotaxis protein [Magnetococcales bacterium]